MNRRQSFDLFGMDILIDKNLRPWLLEVNASPSLECNAKLDKRIKTTLLCDVFNLIGIIPYNKFEITTNIGKYNPFSKNLSNVNEHHLNQDEINMLYEFEEEQDRYYQKMWSF